MGFVQPAKIEKMTIEEINDCIDDEPNNNIVPITGVDSDLLSINDTSENESCEQVE